MNRELFEGQVRIVNPEAALSFENRVPIFQSYFGRNIDMMPQLLTGLDSEGRVVDVPRVLLTGKQRLYEQLHHPRMKLFEPITPRIENGITFMSLDFQVSDVLWYDPSRSGEAVLALYTQHDIVKGIVDSMNPNTPLKGTFLKKDNQLLEGRKEQYEQVKREGAFVFSPDQVSQLGEDPWALPKVRYAFWCHLAEGNKRLVKDTLKLLGRAISKGWLTSKRWWPIRHTMPVYVNPKHKGIFLVELEGICSYFNSARVIPPGYEKGSLVGTLPTDGIKNGAITLDYLVELGKKHLQPNEVPGYREAMRSFLGL